MIFYYIHFNAGKVLIFISSKSDSEDLSRQLQQYLTARRLDIKVRFVLMVMVELLVELEEAACYQCVSAICYLRALHDMSITGSMYPWR